MYPSCILRAKIAGTWTAPTALQEPSVSHVVRSAIATALSDGAAWLPGPRLRTADNSMLTLYDFLNPFASRC